MSYIIKRVKGRGGLYYTGLGTDTHANFADPCWHNDEKKALEYETKDEAVEAAKTIIPRLYYRGVVRVLEHP